LYPGALDALERLRT
jgi:FMN phosphatase YigB (HAD superfamily)